MSITGPFLFVTLISEYYKLSYFILYNNIAEEGRAIFFTVFNKLTSAKMAISYNCMLFKDFKLCVEWCPRQIRALHLDSRVSHIFYRSKN